MEQGPIFVAGIERSGTTLLYALLASHPNIAMTRRTELWWYYYNRFGDLSRPDNLERCLAAMMRYKHLLALEPDWQSVREEFWQGESTYARLFTVVGQQYARRLGRSRWGDKSHGIERHAGVILESCPTARIVHMIRDPRDRYASAYKADRVGRAGAASATVAWLSSVTLAKRACSKYPLRYKVLTFERLLSDPEGTLRDICHFLGEEYAPSMLAMEGAAGFRDKGGNSSFSRHRPGSISRAPIGRFRKVLTQREVAFIQALARREMAAFGYRPEPVQLPLWQRLLHYVVDWPVNMAYIAGWRALTAYKDWRGRVPSARRLAGSPLATGSEDTKAGARPGKQGSSECIGQLSSR